MKKEKTVKTYQRRTKTGKVVTVRQHTAKYDAADKAAEASKKKGSGDELESLKKSKQVDTPMEISKDDFKEWYNFNEWDTPKKEWPESVKKVDSHLRKTMGKKGYDDYCAKIDESWSARGHLKAYKDLSASSSSSPIAKVAKAKVQKEATKSKSAQSNSSDYSSMSDDDLYSAYEKHKANKPDPSSYKGYKTLKDKFEAIIGRKPKNDKERRAKEKELEKINAAMDKWYSTTDGKKFKESAVAHRKVSAAYAGEISKREKAANDVTEKELRKLGFTSKTFEYTPGSKGDGSLRANYKTSWGHTNSPKVDKVIQKVKDDGWKKVEGSSSMQPDDKGYGRVERYISPDGKYELSYNYSAGDFSSNHHSVAIKRVGGKKGAPTAPTAPTKTKSSSSSTKFKSSINEVLNNAGFKNDISSIKVDGDSVKIRLEGKAYGSGYSSYVEYNPSRPKSGYEVEGNPKRAEHVYEALRKLKGIDKFKSLVITESYD